MPAGWDVVELWEAGRFEFLLNLIDHLPRTSAYAQAVAEDDEMAERAPEPSGRPSPPSIRDWTPEVEVLAAMFDRLADVANAVVASGGGKPGSIKPWPRPVTAFDRAKARRSREATDEMARKLFPRGDRPLQAVPEPSSDGRRREYVTKAGKTVLATEAQIAHWTRGGANDGR